MALQRHRSNDFGFVVRNSGSHLTIHCHFAKFGSVHNCTMNAFKTHWFPADPFLCWSYKLRHVKEHSKG